MATPAGDPTDNCLCEAAADDALEEIDRLKIYILKLMETKPIAIMAILDILTAGINDNIVMQMERLIDRMDCEGNEAVLREHSPGCEARAHICICRM